MHAPPLLIATTPPTAAEQRSALAVGAALLLVFACALPFAGVRLPRSDVVVPAVSMIMFIGDCVSAVLLFGQFAVLRTRAMLVLAAGYLFTAVLVVAYAVTFPGPFAPTGMLGAGLQTAGWIFVMWHIGLPVAAIAYALLGGASPDAATTRAGVPVSIAIAIAVAGLVTLFTIEYHDLLPALTSDPVRMVENKTVRVLMVTICATAVIVLARQRRSVLDLWLLVVLFAWLLDSLLTSVTENRYTVAWYANRVIRIVGANIVLFVLLTETVQLYARLALSILAQRREREGRMMTMEAMAATLEHEIRQPLAAITANAAAARRWLDHSPPNLAEMRMAVDDIGADAARTAQILRSVRDIFAHREPAHEPVDVNTLVKETVALARPGLASSDIGVQMQLAENPPVITASRAQVQEVLLNLLNNAAESMRGVTDHATVLRISTAAVGPGRIEIAVADTGSGIDEKHLARIFEPFYSTKPSGLGMGLAICKSIVERHGGTLSASCGEPYGAVFRVQFPSQE